MTNSLKIIFTINQFCKFYMNLGTSYIDVNRSNSAYLLGLYFNISVINMFVVLPIIKKKIFLFFKLLNKNYSDFLIISKIKKDGIVYNMSKKFIFFNISYSFGNWWNGLLRNFKKFLVKKNKKQIYFFYKNRFPLFAIYLSLNRLFIEDSHHILNKEFSSVGLPSLLFVDTHCNLKISPDSVLQNSKSYINYLFLLHLLLELRRKNILLKKKYFFFQTVKNWNFLVFDNCIKKIFFYFFYLNKIKKKSFYLNIKNKWSDY